MWIVRDISEFIFSQSLNPWLQGIILFGVFIGILYYGTRGDPEVRKALRKFSGPRPWPIIGNALLFAVSANDIFEKSFKPLLTKYGEFVLIWMLNKPYIYVTDPDVIEKLLLSNVHIGRSEDYQFVFSWLGTGLLLSNGSKWHSRRKLLTPAFHFKILEGFMGVFNEQTQVLVEILKEKAISQEAFNIHPFLTRCTLDIICESAMSEKIEAQRGRNSEYVTALQEISLLTIKRVMQPWLRSNLLWKLSKNRSKEMKLLAVLKGFADQVIRKRKAERKLEVKKAQDEDSNVYGMDPLLFRVKIAAISFTHHDKLNFHKENSEEPFWIFLDASEDGRLLSDSDIREETDTFIFAGHDTTATCLNFTVYLLASNPGCQKKVHEELDAIFGEEPDRLITTTDLSRMKYLESCIKESLRVYPTVPFLVRQINETFDLGDGRHIPKETMVVTNGYYLHRDPSIYPNPKSYLPERWLASENPATHNQKHPFAYIPFSAGPRNCIGQKFALMKMKMVLAQFFRNFRVESRNKLEGLKIFLLLSPKNDLLISVSTRER